MVGPGQKEATNNLVVPGSCASHHFLCDLGEIRVSQNHRCRSDHTYGKRAMRISQISSDVFIEIGAMRQSKPAITRDAIIRISTQHDLNC
jgi:hypothetical protein